MPLDFIVYGSFIVLLIVSFGLNIDAWLKNRKLDKDKASLVLEKYILAKKLETILTENESKKLEKDDGFIKFLSQSRESAFTYIEEVQEAIGNYANDKTEDNYNKLISFLPNQDEKR